MRLQPSAVLRDVAGVERLHALPKLLIFIIKLLRHTQGFRLVPLLLAIPLRQLLDALLHTLAVAAEFVVTGGLRLRSRTLRLLRLRLFNVDFGAFALDFIFL